MLEPPDLARWRRIYAVLLRLFPARHRQRFGEGMAQTFADVLRERHSAGRSTTRAAIAMCLDTTTALMTSHTHTLLASRLLRRPAIGTAAVLTVPLVMTVLDRSKPPGDGWHWGPLDFVVMAALLLCAGVIYEWLASRGNTRAWRVCTGVAVAAVVIALWAELAVDAVSQLARHTLG